MARDFVWLHPPYWRQKIYSDDPRDLSTAPTLDAFLAGYERLIENCASVLKPGGHLAILMGDYSDRSGGFRPARVPHQLPLLRRRTDAGMHRHHPLLARREQCHEGLSLQFHSRAP